MTKIMILKPVNESMKEIVNALGLDERVLSPQLSPAYGFEYPSAGDVHATWWDPSPSNIDGIFGFLDGSPEHDIMTCMWGKWLVIEADERDLVRIPLADGRPFGKVPRGRVVCCGTFEEAAAVVAAHYGLDPEVVGRPRRRLPALGTFSFEVLRFIAESGAAGRRYSEINELLWKLAHPGENVPPFKERRGWWGCLTRRNRGCGKGNTNGLLVEFCRKNDKGRWTLLSMFKKPVEDAGAELPE